VSNEERKKKIRNNIRSEFAHTYITASGNEVYDRGKTQQGEARIPGRVKRFWGAEQSNLRSLVRKITTKDAKATEEFLVDRIYDSLRRKDATHKGMYQDAAKEFQALGLDDAFIKDYYSEITLTIGGREITTQKKFLLALWLNAEADGNLKRLLTAREHRILGKWGRPIYIKKISLEELHEAAERVPEQYKKLAALMFGLNRKHNAPAINKTMLWERGYEGAAARNYWPFPRYMRRMPSGHKTVIALANENRGRYQPRTGGTLPHAFGDPLIDFLNMMQQDAIYSEITLPLQDAKALLGDSKWRGRQDRAGNAPYVNAIITLYQRSEGIATDRDVADFLAGKFLGRMGKGTLSLRPSGGLIQAASLVAAHHVVGEKYFDPTYVPKPSEAKALMDLDATMFWRWHARHFDYIIGQSSAQDALRRFITGKEAKRDVLLRHYTWGDQWAVLKIWNACKNRIKDTTDLKEGSREFNEAALKIFHRAMETQPQWDTWHRSVFTTSTESFKKSFAMFMSARNAQWNVILQALDDYNKGRIGKGRASAMIGDIVEANLRVSLYRQLFRKLVKYVPLLLLFGMGKRDEEELKEHVRKDIKLVVTKVPQETVFNVMGLPVYGQLVATVVEQALKGFQGRWSSIKYGDVRTGSVLTDFLVDVGLSGWSAGKLGRDIGLALIGDEEAKYKSGPKKGEYKYRYTAMEVSDNIAEIVSQLTGIGYSGLRADIVYPIEQALKQGPYAGLTLSELYKKLDDATNNTTGLPVKGRSQESVDRIREAIRRKKKK